MKERVEPIVSTLKAAAGALALIALMQTGAVAGAVVAQYNLGDDDPGAAAGSLAGAATVDVIAGADLYLLGGAPLYSADVPAGGSTLSIEFAAGDWYSSAAIAAMSTLDFDNFSLQFDAKPTGDGPFPTAVCLGRYGSGAAFVYHAGGTWRFHIGGVGDQVSGPVTLNAWQRIEIRREAGVTRMFIDGMQVGGTSERAFAPSTDLTIGVPINGGGDPDTGGHFIGLIDNVVLTDLMTGAAPSFTGPLEISPGKVYEGNSIILTAQVLADPAGLDFAWRSNAVVIAHTGPTNRLAIHGVTPNASADYDVVVSNNYGTATSTVASVTVLPSTGTEVLRLRLGDDDPGAAAGNPGNAQTVEAILGNSLDAIGTPYYSGAVPPGGGALSMLFDGLSCYRSTDLATFAGNLDQANFSIAFDVYCTALGGGGFSFPVSFGKNEGGIGIVEIGGVWHLIRMGLAADSLGLPVEPDTWTHFEIQRRDFDTQPGIRVFVNGQDMGLQVTPYVGASGILTVGGNTLGDGEGTEGLFTGMVDSVVIKNYSIGALPTITSGPTALPDTHLGANEALTLTVTMSGGTPATYFWRRDGVTVAQQVSGTLSTVTLPAPLPGQYDVVVSNSPAGVVTSSIVAVTIDGRAENASAVTYRLGEDDPGAADGVAGSALTRQAEGLKDLVKHGSPTYSSQAAPGSTLAMSLNGATDWYGGEGARWANFLAHGAFNPDNFSMSCDVYPTGDGAQGFSVALSLGTSGNNYFIYHAGGNWYVHKNGVGNIITGPAVALNAWTHMELVRKDFGGGVETHLFVDGTDVGSTTVPIVPTPAFTVGANRRNVPITDASPVEGCFKGIIDNVVLQTPQPTVSLEFSDGKVLVTATGFPPYVACYLERTPSLSATSWSGDLDMQFTDAGGTVQLTDSAPPAGQAFYRVVAR